MLLRMGRTHLDSVAESGGERPTLLYGDETEESWKRVSASGHAIAGVRNERGLQKE